MERDESEPMTARWCKATAAAGSVRSVTPPPFTDTALALDQALVEPW